MTASQTATPPPAPPPPRPPRQVRLIDAVLSGALPLGTPAEPPR